MKLGPEEKKKACMEMQNLYVIETSRGQTVLDGFKCSKLGTSLEWEKKTLKRNLAEHHLESLKRKWQLHCWEHQTPD